METKSVLINNITCSHCVKTIKSELSELDGIGEIELDPKDKVLTVSWNPPLSWEHIEETLEEISYPASPLLS
jgi:copper chaperone